MSRKVQFNVGMTCDGCSGAVTRILNKVEGVADVACDLEAKTVIVTGTADQAVMLEKLEKWGQAAGKSVELVGEVVEA
eukprot:CAMPEP_0194487246 /NCGR_PEP_ID=MMETSP0253-20130528/7605_1 /TAXON_ID=2966 /ORGANISM="Noctiluca scintillans" /LENGTH=77 /DNA_ID=CAMNT_0039327445 /DNA_START=58 /DNA_END=289 /DNA_ORIENTATION=+